jgi:hypothetical protein
MDRVNTADVIAGTQVKPKEDRGSPSNRAGWPSLPTTSGVDTCEYNSRKIVTGKTEIQLFGYKPALM